MSIHNALRDIYHFLPLRLRLGREFWRLYDFYDKIQHLSYEKRREFQMQELRRVVTHAYEHTRYYRRLFDEYDIRPSQIQDFSDVKKIPILTKKIVRTHLSEMVSDMIPRNKLLYVTTGGSTGKPLGFYITRTVNRKRLVFEWLNWRFMGYEPGLPCAVLRGAVVKDGWFQYDRGENYLILSTYEMTEERIPRYLQKLLEEAPPFLRGYPSALEVIARFILRHGDTFQQKNSIKAISTSSETLRVEQKETIEAAFHCPVFDKYGNSEQVGVIGMCHYSHYHEFMEHSYLEYLDQNGRDIVSGEAEIVGTSFINDAVPFIRYQTGDAVRLSQETHCNCGLESRRIDQIIGRWHGDSIQTKAGNLISLTALNTHSDIFDHTIRIQYYQDTIGVVTLKIIRRPEYTEEDTKKIYAELTQKLGDQAELRIDFVEEIPLTERGKYKMLDQRLRLS